MQTEQFIVEAIDVGYGNTKFTNGHLNGNVICDMFPSIAAPYLYNAAEHGELEGPLETYVVNVGPLKYRVGPDIHFAKKPNHTKTLNSDYASTDPYMACLKGALLNMQHDFLDLLVVGLPCSNYYNTDIRQDLVARIKGDLELTDERKIYIRDVWVLAQPYGGLVDYSRTVKAIRNEYTLLIDPGYFTTDWYVSLGLSKPRLEMIGSAEGGVSSYLTAVSRAIQADTGLKVPDLWLIDRAIKDGEVSCQIGPRSIDLTNYLSHGEAMINQALEAMINMVTLNNEINNIVLVGGGAHLFKNAIEAKFPEYEIYVPADPLFSNVKGFQFAGELKLQASMR